MAFIQNVLLLSVLPFHLLDANQLLHQVTVLIVVKFYVEFESI